MGFLPALEAAARPPHFISCEEAGSIGYQKEASSPPPAMAAALAALRRHGGRVEAVVQNLLSESSNSITAARVDPKSNASKAVAASAGRHLQATGQGPRQHGAATSAATAAAKKRPAGQTDLLAAFGLAGKQGRRT